MVVYKTCVACCGEELCLVHFQTSPCARHATARITSASEHGEQMASFRALWKEAWQSLAGKVAIAREAQRSAQPMDRLESALRPRRAAVREGPGGPGRGRKRPARPKAAADDEAERADPYKRRRSRGGASYWATRREDREAPLDVSITRSGEACRSCGSLDTTRELVGDGSLAARKGEVWGNKDDDKEQRWRILCTKCGAHFLFNDDEL